MICWFLGSVRRSKKPTDHSLTLFPKEDTPQIQYCPAQHMALRYLMDGQGSPRTHTQGGDAGNAAFY